MHGQPTGLHLRAGNRSTPKGVFFSFGPRSSAPSTYMRWRPMGQSHTGRLAFISVACLAARRSPDSSQRGSACPRYRGGVRQRNGQPWRRRPLKATSPTNEPRHRPGEDFPPGASASEPETDPTNSAGTEIFAMQMWLYYVASRDRNRGSLRGGSCRSYFSF